MRQRRIEDRRRSTGGGLQRALGLLALIALTLGMAPAMGTTRAATTVQQEDTPCAATCYVDAVNGSDAFGGASPGFAKQTIQAALAQVDVGGTVIVAPGTYAEAVSITKEGVTLQGAGAGSNPAQHTIIDGPVGASSGIRLPNPSTTGVTISGLRVQQFTGGGICSIGANNNSFTVDSVEVVGNVAGAGCLGGI
jgi:pectin methylesterase-like acyl-CoA thioesterase